MNPVSVSTVINKNGVMTMYVLMDDGTILKKAEDENRWTENTPGWYEQTLADDRDQAVEVLWSLIEHSKEAHMIRSNHTDRLYNVIMKKIPAFLARSGFGYSQCQACKLQDVA